MDRALFVIGTFALAGCGLESMALAPEPPETASDGSIRVELDVLQDATLTASELEVAVASAERTFADANFEIEIATSFERQRSSDKLVSMDEKSRLMRTTRDDAGAVHVILASRGAGAHGVTHYGASKPTRDEAGLFVFVDSIRDDFAANPLLAADGLSEAQLIGRTIAHELGHGFGCGHVDGDASVMVQNGSIGAVTLESLATWREALERPRFADASCLRRDARLGVELARPAYAE